MLILGGCLYPAEDSMTETQKETQEEIQVSILEEPVSVKEIPRIVLSLQDVTWDEINSGSKDTKYKGNTAIIEDGNTTIRYENVQLKGRGNSTWDWPKKPYQIKFADPVDLFGMGEARIWILLANYRDVSLMRNEIAFHLARELRSPYAIRGTFAELYVEEQYIGLYHVTQKVEIGRNTVNLIDPLGVLIEVESAREADDIHIFSDVSNTCLVLKEAVQDDDHDARNKALEAFGRAFDRLEAAAYNGDWKMVQKEIDVESFVHYFLISEFTANPDAYVSSFYLYRDGDKDVIHAGPVWDFDMAFANAKYIYGDATSPNRTWVYEDPRELLEMHPAMSVPLFAYLMDLPEFRREVEVCYREELRPILERLPETIQTLADAIEEKAVVDQDVWHTHSKYSVEVEKLMAWFDSRTAYMDLLYGGRVMVDGGTYIFTVNGEEFCWNVEHLSDDSYRISDQNTGLTLGVTNAASIADGQAVGFGVNDVGNGQRWIFAQNEANELYLLSKATGLAFDFCRESQEMTVMEYSGDESQRIVLCEEPY